MKTNYDVIIVGGGVQGLSLAYHLARNGIKKLVVLEKSYIGSGASGRNGEMIRSAFGSVEWIRLFNRSLQIWETLSEELDFNVMFTGRGYLMMASSAKEETLFRANIELQSALGLQTHTINSKEIIQHIPTLNQGIARGGLFQKNAGVARHDAVVWAYQNAAQRLGADVFPFTEVIDVIVDAGRVSGVKTNRGAIGTRTVVNAAGAHAGKVAQMAGVKLPLDIYRLEMIVTEPLKPFLNVPLSVPGLMSYMHQTARGEFAGGAEPAGLSPFTGLKSTIEATQDMARKFVLLFPGLHQTRLMRQWSGIVAKSPDRGPVLGAVDQVEGFMLNTGWGGYGFMGAPVGGEMMAELITGGVVPDPIRPFSLQRFTTGELVNEPTIIGVEKPVMDPSPAVPAQSGRGS
jgi:sarcosine oxidase subunit beta